MPENLFDRFYALQECISNGYNPTAAEQEWLDYAEERILDWKSDVDFSY